MELSQQVFCFFRAELRIIEREVDRETMNRLYLNIAMRIGLISDTHHGLIPKEVREVFNGVDLILHAGDICGFTHPWTLDDLETMAPVIAVKGNEDKPEILCDKRVKEKQSLTVEGIKFSIIHDILSAGFPLDQANSYWLVDINQFNNVERVCLGVTDIYVFGHTHKPVIDYIQGSLFINPGSPTEPDHEMLVGKLGTVGILDITPGRVEVRIAKLENGFMSPIDLLS